MNRLRCMPRFPYAARIAFASAMIALGVIGLALRDFAAVWGPLPAWAHARTTLAVVYSLVPLVAGIALFFKRTAAAAALVLVAYVALWWILFKVVPVFRAPLTELSWLDAGMYAMLLAGAWTLFADLGGRPFLGDARGVRMARVLFALGLIPTGLSHFVYLPYTVPLIPAFFPFRQGWAYITGACHLAAGLGVLVGVFPRLAAQLEALMLLLFTVIVWVPRVIAAPLTSAAMTMFAWSPEVLTKRARPSKLLEFSELSPWTIARRNARPSAFALRAIWIASWSLVSP